MEKTAPVIRLNDIFWTFQGEGKHSGRSALFIRLPFCNYSCPWCDTDYNSVNYKLDETEFKEWLDRQPSNFAVITGGEPTINPHYPIIVEWLKKYKFEIAIETNGSNFNHSNFLVDFITISPKKAAPRNLPEFYVDSLYYGHAENYPEKIEFKYVVEEGFDFKLIDDLLAMNLGCRISLSPEFNIFDKSMEMLLGYIEKNPQIRYSLQTHKWANIK